MLLKNCFIGGNVFKIEPMHYKGRFPVCITYNGPFREVVGLERYNIVSTY